MATKYNVFTTSETPVATRAKKDGAIAFGEKLGESFRVVTDSGTVVHEFVAEETTVDAPAEDLIGDVADEPAPVEQDEDEDEDEDQPKPGTKNFDVASMKRKISGLLAKAERSDNEAERDAFNAKAEKLMLRLGINQAELEAAGTKKAEKIIEERISWQNVYAKNLVNFSGIICTGIGNLTWLQSGRWADATVFIIGHKSDVELAVRLINSLQLQAFAALKVWQKSVKEERKGMNNYDKLVGNRSFLHGFAVAASNRLAAERDEVEAEASTGAALVLASKMDRVMDALNEMHPKLGKARGGNGRFSSKAGAAGAAAGKQADIGSKRVGGKKGELA